MEPPVSARHKAKTSFSIGPSLVILVAKCWTWGLQIQWILDGTLDRKVVVFFWCRNINTMKTCWRKSCWLSGSALLATWEGQLAEVPPKTQAHSSHPRSNPWCRLEPGMSPNICLETLSETLAEHDSEENERTLNNRATLLVAPKEVMLACRPWCNSNNSCPEWPVSGRALSP